MLIALCCLELALLFLLTEFTYSLLLVLPFATLVVVVGIRIPSELEERVRTLSAEDALVNLGVEVDLLVLDM